MDIQLPQILFQLINFSVVVGALTYLLYKPVLKILEERASRIEEAQKAARTTLQEKERLAEVEKDIVRNAEKKAAQIVEQARLAAKETEAASLEKAKIQAQKEVEKAKNEWESEKKKHLQTMQNEFTSSVIATAGKVLAAELDEKKHSKLIDDQIAQLLKQI